LGYWSDHDGQKKERVMSWTRPGALLVIAVALTLPSGSEAQDSELLPSEPTSAEHGQPQDPEETEPVEPAGVTEAIDLEFRGETVGAMGTAVGQVDASRWGVGCVGLIAETPNVLLTVTGGMPDLLVEGAGADLTLVIVHEDGTIHCVDDGLGGTNPFVNLWNVFPTTEGQYQLFIGTKDGGPHNFTVRVEDGAG
jgi:hypothetical protein